MARRWLVVFLLVWSLDSLYTLNRELYLRTILCIYLITFAIASSNVIYNINFPKSVFPRTKTQDFEYFKYPPST
jgi:Na+/serine symporter